jgi:hypothetical protein
MSDRAAQKSRWPDAHDYRAAIAKAVEWLGDRYLLAKPVNSPANWPAVAGAYQRSIASRGTAGTVTHVKNRAQLQR